MTYPFVAGVLMLLAWLVNVLSGGGSLDLAGKVIGTDYMQFYTAGLTVRLGQEMRLYDFEYQQALQQQVIGKANKAFYAYLNPPFLAWLFVPLSMLPYALSYAAFCLLVLIGVWLSLHWLGLPRSVKPFLLTLTFFPVFANLSFGQNGVLSLAILALVYFLWRSRQGLAAGLALSLLLYKPQLTIGILLLWLIDARHEWRSLAGFGMGALALAGLSFGFLPGASRNYVQVARLVLPAITSWDTFPLWHTVTWQGFWLLLVKWIPAAEVLTGLFSLLGLYFFTIFLFRLRGLDRDIMPLKYAGAVCLSAWLAPHALIYDWAILIVPAVLLWQALPDRRDMLRALYAVVWIAGFISGPLAVAQLAVLPVALNVAMPAFALSVLTLGRSIVERPPASILAEFG